ncbi:MAG: hypothetical protein M0R17_07000 [Candidatus Omnitrophica bacterium]|jgi:hypothetical protein|nr:hypothetical protein [Candidatus Omnitrophota bacterium]
MALYWHQEFGKRNDTSGNRWQLIEGINREIQRTENSLKENKKLIGTINNKLVEGQLKRAGDIYTQRLLYLQRRKQELLNNNR